MCAVNAFYTDVARSFTRPSLHSFFLTPLTHSAPTCSKSLKWATRNFYAALLLRGAFTKLLTATSWLCPILILLTALSVCLFISFENKMMCRTAGVTLLVVVSLITTAVSASRYQGFICQTANTSRYFHSWVRLQHRCPNLPSPMDTWTNIGFAKGSWSTDVATWNTSSQCMRDIYNSEMAGVIREDSAPTCDLTYTIDTDEDPCNALEHLFNVSGWGCADYMLPGASYGTVSTAVSALKGMLVSGLDFCPALLDADDEPNPDGNICWSFTCAFYNYLARSQTPSTSGPPSSYTCPAETWNDGTVCNCNCGAWDPDCDVKANPTADGTMLDSMSVVCTAPGRTSPRVDVVPARKTMRDHVLSLQKQPRVFVRNYVPDFAWYPSSRPTDTPIPASWTCPWQYFNASDGCDCDCGAWDPDCDVPNMTVTHCPSNIDTCVRASATCLSQMTHELEADLSVAGAVTVTLLLLTILLTECLCQRRNVEGLRSFEEMGTLALRSQTRQMFPLWSAVQTIWTYYTFALRVLLVIIGTLSMLVAAVVKVIYGGDDLYEDLSAVAIMMLVPSGMLLLKWSMNLQWHSIPFEADQVDGQRLLPRIVIVHEGLQVTFCLIFILLAIMGFPTVGFTFVAVSILIRTGVLLYLRRGRYKFILHFIGFAPIAMTCGMLLLCLAKWTIMHGWDHATPPFIVAAILGGYSLIYCFIYWKDVKEYYNAKSFVLDYPDHSPTELAVERNLHDKTYSPAKSLFVFVVNSLFQIVGMIMGAVIAGKFNLPGTSTVISFLSIAWIVVAVWGSYKRFKKLRQPVMASSEEMPINSPLNDLLGYDGKPPSSFETKQTPDNSSTWFATTIVYGTMLIMALLLIAGSKTAAVPEASYGPIELPAESTGYASCGTRFPQFGLSAGRFSLVDMAFLARFAYISDPLLQKEAIPIILPSYAGFPEATSNITVKQSTRVMTSEIRFHSWNLTVIAVRGTVSSADWLEDLTIWGEGALLHVGQTLLFLPLGKFAPIIVEIFASLRSYGRGYVDVVADRVRALQAEGQEVMLVGHSLGAGVSNIVGAMLHVQAVGFEGPGIEMQRDRFNFTQSDADLYAYNTYMSGDPVPFMDYQAGNIQHLRANCGASCHFMSTIIANLRRSCGDLIPRTIS